MNRFLAILLLACSAICFAQAPQIKSGSTVFIEPMGGYETYLAAALLKKSVPLIVVLDKDKATYVIHSTINYIQPNQTQPRIVINNSNTIVTNSNPN